MIDELLKPGFDPRRTVILESEPAPRPSSAAPSAPPPRVWVADESTDHADIELELSSASILLMTSAYSEGWRARALDGSEQREYTLLPADHVLRAVPLRAGRHRLRLEYEPGLWQAAIWSSTLSGTAFLGATAFWATRRRRVGGG